MDLRSLSDDALKALAAKQGAVPADNNSLSDMSDDALLQLAQKQGITVPENKAGIYDNYVQPVLETAGNFAVGASKGIDDLAETVGKYSGTRAIKDGIGDYIVNPALEAITGKTYPTAVELRERKKEFYDKHYGDSTAAMIGRGVAPSLIPMGGAAKAVQFAEKGLSKAPKLAKALKAISNSRVVKASTAGAAGAALTSEGYDEPLSDQMALGAMGGVLGDTAMRLGGKGLSYVPYLKKYIQSEKDIGNIAKDIVRHTPLKEGTKTDRRAYKDYVVDYLKDIQTNKEILESDQIAGAHKRIGDAKKVGYNLDMNQAFGGIFDSEAMAGRGSMASYVRSKVKNVDDENIQDVQRIINSLIGNAKDPSIVGENVRQRFKDIRKGEKENVSQHANQFYEAAMYDKPIPAKFISDTGGKRATGEPISRGPVYKQIDNAQDLKSIEQDPMIQEAIHYVQKNAFDSLKHHEYGDAPDNSVALLLKAKERLGEMARFDKDDQSKLRQDQAKHSRHKLADILHRYDPLIRRADNIHAEKHDAFRKSDIDKYGQIMAKQDVTVGHIVENLMNNSTSSKQLYNLSRKLDDEQKKDIALSFIKKKYDDIDSEQTLDLLHNKAFKKEGIREKLSILAGGKDTEFYKNIENAMNAVRSIKSKKLQNVGSNTHNKQLADHQSKQLSGMAEMSSATAKGALGAVGAHLLRAASRFAPLMQNRVLDMNRREQEAFFNFYNNPQNTEIIIDAIARLNLATKRGEVEDIIQNIPGISQFVGSQMRASEAAERQNIRHKQKENK